MRVAAPNGFGSFCDSRTRMGRAGCSPTLLPVALFQTRSMSASVRGTRWYSLYS